MVKKHTPETFWNKVAPPDENGCMVWQGTVTVDGYGQLVVDGMPVRAHRWAHELTYGPISCALCVLHKCDNRLCCNPDHLFVGTKAENNRDRTRKGRAARGRSHWAVILTEKQICEIRNAPRGYGTGRPLAAKYGVSEITISGIRSGRMWKHLDCPTS